jgi:hypothetical protein
VAALAGAPHPASTTADPAVAANIVSFRCDISAGQATGAQFAARR